MFLVRFCFSFSMMVLHLLPCSWHCSMLSIQYVINTLLRALWKNLMLSKRKCRKPAPNHLAGNFPCIITFITLIKYNTTLITIGSKRKPLMYTFLPHLIHLTIKGILNRDMERHGKGQILPMGAKWPGVWKFDSELKVVWENINPDIWNVTQWPLQCFEMESFF